MNYSFEELLPVLTSLSEKYTGNQSTSITYETAEQLMGAIQYCIEEEGLFESEAPFESEIPFGKEPLSMNCQLMEQSGEESAEAAYQKGYERVLKKTMEAKKLYDEMIQDLPTYGNRAYYDTLVKGMPSFFLYYNPRFHPQDHLLTLDYPTIKPITDKLCGIDVIYEYLTCIYQEKIFLSAFPEAFIRKVLEEYHNDHEELIINICEIVLKSVIQHMILKKQMAEKRMKYQEETQEEIQKEQAIREFAEGKTQEELEEEIQGMLKIFINNHYNQNEKLYEYLTSQQLCFREVTSIHFD